MAMIGMGRLTRRQAANRMPWALRERPPVLVESIPRYNRADNSLNVRIPPLSTYSP
jgi:hypothetical protein